MTKETFLQLLNSIKEVDKFIDDSYELGIDMINSKLVENIAITNKILMSEAFTEEGWDWIEWYLYEDSRKIITDEIVAKDKEGNTIDFSSDDKLWDFLIKYGYYKERENDNEN